MKKNFITYEYFENYKAALSFIQKQDEKYWSLGAMNNAFKIYNFMLKKVRAYPKFLKDQKVNPNSIKRAKNICFAPIMNKQNYFNKYPFEDMLVGNIGEMNSFYMSSGSTGEPLIWPRVETSDLAYDYFVDFYYNLYWQIAEKSTLYISAMDLGIWASGNLQFHAASHCAKKYNFTFANPGADFTYIYYILKKIAHKYDQVIIATYPSLARKLIDYLTLKGDINLRKLNIRLMLGGEPHTVEWRYYIQEKLGYDKENLTVVLDYYGTSDSGGPGASTPLTTLIQNLCKKDRNLCIDLFGQVVVPSLFQKNPFLFVESSDKRILVTYPGRMPICRYDTGDTGGVLNYSDVMTKIESRGYVLNNLLKSGANYLPTWKWPFIFLSGRSDFSVNIGGSLVFPSDIEGLFFGSLAKDINSFKLAVEHNINQHQELRIYLELKENISYNILKKQEEQIRYTNLILDQLLKNNPDYEGAYNMDRKLCKPKVVICEFQKSVFKGDLLLHKSKFIKKT
ncbi:hypothetical protein IPM62_06035 [Candidatus Woesebacteria bacterium]|nr:MAG: hypothetical protein IPM62_06035 [Candidatus Woesebacteria bacterium]